MGNFIINVDFVLDISYKKNFSYYDCNVFFVVGYFMKLFFIFVQLLVNDILFLLLEKFFMLLCFVYLYICLNIYDLIFQYVLLCCVINYINYYIYIYIYDLFLMINSVIQLQLRYL